MCRDTSIFIQYYQIILKVSFDNIFGIWIRPDMRTFTISRHKSMKEERLRIQYEFQTKPFTWGILNEFPKWKQNSQGIWEVTYKTLPLSTLGLHLFCANTAGRTCSLICPSISFPLFERADEPLFLSCQASVCCCFTIRVSFIALTFMEACIK